MSASDCWFQWLRRFSWLGIDSRPKAYAFLTALIIFLGVLVVAEAWLYTPTFWKYARMEHIDKLPNDDRIALELARNLQMAVKSKLPLVLLLGGSTSRELTASDDFVSTKVSKLCGKDVFFVNAGTSSQSIVEAWALVDSLKNADLKLVIVGYNYFRLTESFQSLQRGVGTIGDVPIPRSHDLFEHYLRVLQTIPPMRLVDALGISAHMGGLLLPMGSNPPVLELTLLPSTVTKIAAYASQLPSSKDSAVVSDEEKQNPFRLARNAYKAFAPKPFDWKRERSENFMAVRGPEMLASMQEAALLWDDFQQYIKSLDAKMLYLVLPVDPSMSPVRKRLDASFDQVLAGFRHRGASVVDWRDGHDLGADDFFDQQHLLESGRRKLANNFNHLIVENLDLCKRTLGQ